MSDGIESKSDELSSKNRISVIAFRKQPNKKNSVKSQPDVEKVPTTNLEAEVEIKTENPNEILVKVDTETKIEDEIEKVKLNVCKLYLDCFLICMSRVDKQFCGIST